MSIKEMFNNWNHAFYDPSDKTKPQLFGRITAATGPILIGVPVAYTAAMLFNEMGFDPKVPFIIHEPDIVSLVGASIMVAHASTFAAVTGYFVGKNNKQVRQDRKLSI